MITRIVKSPPTWKILLEPSEIDKSHENIVFDSEKTRVTKELEDSKLQANAVHSKKTFEEDSKWGDICANAVWKKFNELKPQNATQKEIQIVLAGFVLRGHDDEPRVIAIGSGNKCIKGDNFSLEGSTLHDSHAEIIARRSLLRWLYQQVETAGLEGSLVVDTGDTNNKLPFSLVPFDLWLYISKTPCGDSAIFSQSDSKSSSAFEVKFEPIWSKNKTQGLLRTKMEETLGTRPSFVKKVQSVDGLVQGEQSMSYSCSDKLAKWAVLGVQGALLSRLIPPVILKGVVIGDGFSYGHACRAFCCRSDRAFNHNFSAMPTPFKLNHIRITEARSTKHRHLNIVTVKGIYKNALSMNWADGDTYIEETSSTTGRLMMPSDSFSSTYSRISKKNLFLQFCRYVPQAEKKSYLDNKAQAKLYQRSKIMWLDAMSNAEFGFWNSKPRDFGDFLISVPA